MSTVTMEDVSDTINPADKTLSSSSGADSEAKEISDDTSTKATEENDSDTTMETKKDAGSDVETDVDDAGSATAAAAATGEDSRTQEEKDQEAKEKEEAEKKRIEELKIKYKDWPLKDIKEPHENDVMYGRGGGTNHHPGNKRYRKMVESRKVKYVNSKRLDKPLVALEIIREWRAQLPPGRFLKHNDKTGNWDDVGDKKAREKTSQALREKAPQIRAQQEEEQEGVSRRTITKIILQITRGKYSILVSQQYAKFLTFAFPFRNFYQREMIQETRQLDLPQAQKETKSKMARSRKQS